MKHSLILFFFVFVSSSRKFKLNDLFFYDPISEEICDHKNYWTPFNPNTTCYRWVNLNSNDTEDDNTIMIMLDNNIQIDNYTRVDFLLKALKAKWKRYTGDISLPDEDILYKLMKYKKEPEINSTSSPGYLIGEMILNNKYTIKGIKTNSNGYWLNKSYDDTYAYAITAGGSNALINKKEKIGIRPVIVIKKDLLNVMPDAVDLTSFVKEGKLYKYLFENVTHGGVYYKQLQAFTIADDRLIYTSSHSKNTENCMLYSYKGENYSVFANSLYDKCGHGNGITWDSKKDKILVTSAADWTQINQYDPYNLTYETYYSKNDSYTHF
ncbi:MAG: hypothetical protein MJ252_07445, partial [archaeon]|nr:hypothetical protein [archaeon]